MPIGSTGLDNVEGKLTGCRLVEGDVEEAGSGDVHAVDTGVCAQLFGKLFCQFPRRNSCLFGKLKGCIGRPVAVVAVLRPLHSELVGDCQGQAVIGENLDGLCNCCFEIFRSHRDNDITPAPPAGNQVPRHRLSRVPPDRTSTSKHPA